MKPIISMALKNRTFPVDLEPDQILAWDSKSKVFTLITVAPPDKDNTIKFLSMHEVDHLWISLNIHMLASPLDKTATQG